MKSINISEIASSFNIEGDAIPYGNGHINDTYLLSDKKYILQRINTNVFTNAEELMNNIFKVTEHLRKEIALCGGNPDKETLTFLKTKDGKNLYTDTNGNKFRAYKFVDNTSTIEAPENPEQLYKAAKGFAKFQKRLADFPADTLFEIIENFHNTPSRFKALKQAISEDKPGRAANVENEIEFALAQKNWIGCVADGLADGSIPLRVTHNDTKINNILFDDETHDAICVIDLDTVMPGSMLYDFGDALRTGAVTAAEDETDLSKIDFDLKAFEAFAKGYAEEMADSLTKKEIELLPLSAKLLAYECGIRFLTDYLQGDTYFKIHRPNHNLDRARAQFKIVQSMDAKFDEMKGIIDKYFL